MDFAGKHEQTRKWVDNRPLEWFCLSMVASAKQLTPVVAFHGEGPVWWPRLGVLRFLDVQAGIVCTLEKNGRVKRQPIGSAIAACIRPRVEGGAIVATERGLAIANKDNLRDIRPWGGFIADVRQRCNDGGCDPDGRFYIGPKGYARQPEIAALYRIDPGSASAAPVLWGLTEAAGLAWSPDGATAYLNDAGTGITYSFDYTLEHGLQNQRAFLVTPPEKGRPKGLTVDAEGGLWISMDTMGRIDRYDRSGVLTGSVRVPVPGVTACAFGGPELSTMFITTSASNVTSGSENKAGAIFSADVGVRGLPVLPFRGEIPRHYT